MKSIQHLPPDLQPVADAVIRDFSAGLEEPEGLSLICEWLEVDGWDFLIADLGPGALCGTATPPSGHVVKFNCPKCRRMQGMAFDGLFSGSMAKESIKTMVDAGVRKGHGFGCLACGHTWANQVL